MGPGFGEAVAARAVQALLIAAAALIGLGIGVGVLLARVF